MKFNFVSNEVNPLALIPQLYLSVEKNQLSELDYHSNKLFWNTNFFNIPSKSLVFQNNGNIGKIIEPVPSKFIENISSLNCAIKTSFFTHCQTDLGVGFHTVFLVNQKLTFILC